MDNSSNIYIYSGVFEYGSASCNRLLAYSKGFLMQGYHPIIIPFYRFKMEGYQRQEGVEIKPLKPTFITNKIIRYFISIVYLCYFVKRYQKRTDRMMVYGTGLHLLSFFLAGRNNLWVETTESPNIVKSFLSPRWLTYMLCRRMKGMFVISTALREIFISHGVCPNKIKIIHMIVDADRFSSVIKQEIDDKYLAYCGLVSKNKDGVLGLLKSFSIYHKVFPDRKLKVIGKIANDLNYIDLFRIVEEEGIKDYVEFTGLLSPADMPQVLMNAEMLLLSRPNNEQARCGFPTKLGEYLLTRQPVVVTNVGDIGLFLKDKKNALVVKPGSIEGFASAMIWCSEHPEEAKEIGQMGYQTALASFNNQTECKKIVNSLNS